MRLEGLSIDDANAHRGLCHTLAMCGLDQDNGVTPPKTIVLDWQSSQSISAEGLAFFAILLEVIGRRGIRLFVCLPDRHDSAEIIAESGVRAGTQNVEWIQRACSGKRTTRSFVQSALFNSTSRKPLNQFLSDISHELTPLVTDRKVKLIVGAAMEVVQNMLSHANATNCAMSALYLGSKRPPIVQLGFADNGRGIPSSITEIPAHSWGQNLSDTSVTERVVQGALTRRSSGDGVELPLEGGMGMIFRRLLSECNGEIYVRSGTALVSAQSAHPNYWKKNFMDHGLGTQLRIAIAIDKGG